MTENEEGMKELESERIPFMETVARMPEVLSANPDRFGTEGAFWTPDSGGDNHPCVWAVPLPSRPVILDRVEFRQDAKEGDTLFRLVRQRGNLSDGWEIDLSGLSGDEPREMWALLWSKVFGVDGKSPEIEEGFRGVEAKAARDIRALLEGLIDEMGA